MSDCSVCLCSRPCDCEDPTKLERAIARAEAAEKALAELRANMHGPRCPFRACDPVQPGDPPKFSWAADNYGGILVGSACSLCRGPMHIAIIAGRTAFCLSCVDSLAQQADEAERTLSPIGTP